MDANEINNKNFKRDGNEYLKIIFFILFVIISILYMVNGKKISDLLYKFDSFKGIIVRKELNLHNSPEIVVNQINKEITHGIRNMKIYDTITPGDYIIKERGTMNYILIKNKKDTIIFQP